MELKVDGWENIVLRCSIGSYSTLERGCQHGVVVKENDGALRTGTHQHLEKRAAEGTFRLDLYHRLAVFPIEVPALRERLSDVPALAEFFLAELGKEAPRKRLSSEALVKLQKHGWNGNVRELAHVLERATILAADAAEIGADEIRFRRATR